MIYYMSCLKASDSLLKMEKERMTDGRTDDSGREVVLTYDAWTLSTSKTVGTAVLVSSFRDMEQVIVFGFSSNGASGKRSLYDLGARLWCRWTSPLNLLILSTCFTDPGGTGKCTVSLLRCSPRKYYSEEDWTLVNCFVVSWTRQQLHHHDSLVAIVV